MPIGGTRKKALFMANADPNHARAVDLSVSPAAATFHTLAISLPLVAGLIAVYAVFSPKPSSLTGLATPSQALLFMAALVLGTLFHEMLHALGWAYFGRLPLRRIRFGFHVRTMTPYAHAVDPMPARAYRLGAVLPALLLGALPYILGTSLGSLALALFGTVHIFAAAGDLLVLWLMRNVDARVLVQDHPSRVGCTVVEMEQD